MADRSAFLKLARARFRMAQEADQKQRERELEDIRFYNGQQWDKDLLDSRKGQAIGSGTTQQIVPARPSLTINKTREPVRQVLNQERQSEMSVELVPADDWGGITGAIDHTEIELREGIVRRIQRDSEAADARTWAFSRAVIAGRGYWLVNTRYVPGKTSDQEVHVCRVYNQASITLDPAHEQPDGSDSRWGFIWADIPIDQYKAEFKRRNGHPNRLATFSDEQWRALGDDEPDWFTTEQETSFVRVGDYYYEELESKTLHRLKSGDHVWSDELPEDFDKSQIEDTRMVVERVIKWCKIDGCDDDVLEETVWPGHYIPIIKVVGEELQPADKERRSEGIVRPMEDSCRGFNYITSKFVERVGLTPIPPWMMAAGQDEGYEDEYNNANTRALSRLHYNQKDSFGQPAPPPFKPNQSADVADVAMGVQMFSDAIVSTSRVPETALGHVDPSVKSGKLANALIQQAEQGSSNYLDNLKRSMRHEARVLNDLLFPIYGSRPGRLGRLMNPSGKMTSVIIGQPFTLQGEGPKARPVPAPVPPGWQPGQPLPDGVQYVGLTQDAEFNVAVKVTRATDTRRQEITQMLGEIISASPEQMGVIGDLIWKYADAPEHEELEKRYKAMLLPPVQAAINGQQSVPPEIQAKLAQADATIQELSQLADKNNADLMKAKLQAEADVQVKQMEIASREKIALIQAATTMNVAQGKIDAEDARTFVDAMENRLSQQLDLHMAKLGAVHDAIQQGHEHGHEMQMADADRAHQQQLANQQAEQGLTTLQMQQAHDAEMAQQAQPEATE